jgi:predicted Zn-dependent protease
MIYQRVIPVLVCAALLSACAAGGQGSGSAGKAPTLAVAMSEADSAVMAGQNDKAYGILRNASSTFPTEKTPWLRMAQMRFDTNNYGEAIVNAQEALQRDPEDTLANSIVAVSGLRLSSKALADLSQRNNLTGPVRSEAQDLAKLLREALGEKDLVPSATTHAIAAGRGAGRHPAAAAPAPRQSAASSDPFGALK